jgi:4a-hydroxytetrahydrobiopterin dehydratase
MSTKALTETQILKKLAGISGWMTNKKQTELSKSFTTDSFVDGLALTARITVHAELLNHHPIIELSYGMVKVTLTTHDVKGLSIKDFELAERIDAVKMH